MDCSLSMGFSRQEYWSGLPFPPLGEFPNPVIKLMSPVSPALAGRFFTTEPPGKSYRSFYTTINPHHANNVALNILEKCLQIDESKLTEKKMGRRRKETWLCFQCGVGSRSDG